MNLSLFTVTAFLIIDTDGHRVLAKYYYPQGHPNGESRKLATVKEQRAFEKGLFQKTKKAGGDIILYDSHLAVYKHSLDLIFYIIGEPSENELMLNSPLTAFSDAMQVLLRNQVEKRAVLENLDLVLLCLDEIIDEGVILETDATTIASRVSRPRADPADIGMAELRSAYNTMKVAVQHRMLSG